VNAKVPTTNRTSDQIRAIFSGKLTNWSQVDPAYAAPVQVMSRTTDSGTRVAFDRLFVAPSSEPGIISAGCAGDGSTSPEYCPLSSADEVYSGPGRSNLTTDDDQPCSTPDNADRCRG
jgi:ABC-type phosphate transport system substrate-binding protein